MRLFTALDLPHDALLRLEQMLEVLRPEAAIHWSPRENLHITTKFIGQWPDERLDQLDAALQRLRLRESFDVAIERLGWFPNMHSPRVFFANAKGGDALAHLASETEDALVELGVAKDPRPFSPHLTLARIKSAASLQSLRLKAEAFEAQPIAEFRATSFYLYRSDAGSTASIYRKLRTYPFESSPS